MLDNLGTGGLGTDVAIALNGGHPTPRESNSPWQYLPTTSTHQHCVPLQLAEEEASTMTLGPAMSVWLDMGMTGTLVNGSGGRSGDGLAPVVLERLLVLPALGAAGEEDDDSPQEREDEGGSERPETGGEASADLAGTAQIVLKHVEPG